MRSPAGNPSPPASAGPPGVTARVVTGNADRQASGTVVTAIAGALAPAGEGASLRRTSSRAPANSSNAPETSTSPGRARFIAAHVNSGNQSGRRPVGRSFGAPYAARHTTKISLQADARADGLA